MSGEPVIKKQHHYAAAVLVVVAAILIAAMAYWFVSVRQQSQPSPTSTTAVDPEAALRTEIASQLQAATPATSQQVKTMAAQLSKATKVPVSDATRQKMASQLQAY